MKKRLLSIVITAVIIVGIIPSNIALALDTDKVENNSAVFLDMPKDWSTEALNNAINNGLLSGYNNRIMPEDNLTRAQMVAIVNRAFGSIERANLSSYIDVTEDAWYYDDMAKAVQMKIFVGSQNKLSPDNNITREEAFIVLTRALKLSGAAERALDQFTDKDLISEWAKDGIATLVAAGYVEGSNGKLDPKQYITRAEFAQLMDKLIKKYINKADTYTEDISGSVMINVPDVTLKDVKITGDLIIGDGVGDGDVTLNNVVVIGRTVIRGGGIHSIKILGASDIQNITIARVNGELRVYAEDGLEIGEIIVDGNDDVIIEGRTGTVMVTASDVTVTATRAKIGSGYVEGNNSKIIVSENSAIQTAEINGENAEIIVVKGATVGNIIANGKGADISGEGKIDRVEARADNITVSTPGTKVTASEGLSGVKAGTKNVSEGNTETVPWANTDNSDSGDSDSNQNVSSPLASYAPITLTQTGDVANNNVQYQSAEEVIAALPTQITVTLENTLVVNVPITWTDTDVYNATGAAIYTFTATWGTMPAEANNADNLLAPRVEVTVAAGLIPTAEEYFIFESETGTITGYNRDGGLDVVIPSTIGGVTVMHIGYSAFNSGGKGSSDSEKLTSVIIPHTVISIGNRAFAANLLTEVNIPESVTSIGGNAFYNCMELLEFIVDTNNNNYSSLNGVLFNKDKTILLQFPAGKESENYSVPDTVISIGEEAFYRCTGLTSEITLPESVTNIGDYAFQGCTGLSGVILSEGLESIGGSAFEDCTGLSSVTLPEGLISIGSSAFGRCEGIRNIIIPDSVTSIGSSAFWNCIALESIIIPNNVTEISDSLFMYCTGLESVTIGNSVATIQSNAFSGCTGIESVIIPSSVATIESSAFVDCTGLTEFIVDADNSHYSDLDGILFNKDQSILVKYPLGKMGGYVIPATVTSVGDYAFTSCTGLSDITIPDGMISIGYFSFSSCTGITNVTIPASVTSIDIFGFSGCTNLTRVTMERSDTTIGGSAFPGYGDIFRTAYQEGGAGTYVFSMGQWTKE